MRLTYEQPTSAHRALRGARIRHGDTTKVKIAVGVVPSESGSHIAFCSAWVEAGKIVRRGRHWERRQSIRGEIVFANADEIAERIGGRRGIVCMQGTVTTNGHVEFRIDPDSVQVFPVDRQEECNLRSMFGQSLAREILATAV